jgi:hypothetical protein
MSTHPLPAVPWRSFCATPGRPTTTIVLPRSDRPGSCHVWPCRSGSWAKANAPCAAFTGHYVALTATSGRSSQTCSPSNGLGLLPRVSNTTNWSTSGRHAPPCAALSSTAAPLSMILESPPLSSPPKILKTTNSSWYQLLWYRRLTRKRLLGST